MFDSLSPGGGSADTVSVDADGAPVEPEWPRPSAADEARWLEDSWLMEQAELAGMSPGERFEREYGPGAIPAWVSVAELESAAAAASMQDRVVQLERVQRIAEAQRVTALLQAYEVSQADLARRFPAQLGGRGGLGAQAFFKSMGLQTQTHPLSIAGQVDAALALRDRLPKTWAVFQRGDASWRRCELVVQQAEGLDAEHWPDYDDTASGAVASSSRLKDTLRKARERLQDGTAARRARATHERRHTILELGADGAAAFTVAGTAPDWVGFAHALHRAAVAAHGAEGETRTVTQLEHDIVRDLLVEGIKQRADPAWMGLQVPQRHGVEVQLILTVPALAWLGRTAEQAQLGGYGPIDLETAKSLAGTAKSFIRVLTDPVTGVRLTMDRTARTPPTDLARWVRIRDGRSRFPGSTRPAHLCDIDHAREWQHDGGTNEVNLITLDRPDHTLKSHDLFSEVLLGDGTVEWEDAWGHRFIDPAFDPLDPAPRDLLPNDTDADEPAPF